MFYDEMQTIFGSGMATGKFVVGPNEPLGDNSYRADSGLGKVEGLHGNHVARDKTKQGKIARQLSCFPPMMVGRGRWPILVRRRSSS
jgi:hypothetical protein